MQSKTASPEMTPAGPQTPGLAEASDSAEDLAVSETSVTALQNPQSNRAGPSKTKPREHLGAPSAGVGGGASPPQSEDATSQNAGKLEPTPDPRSSGPIKPETASFKGVVPGKTTLLELQQLWGAPREVAPRGNQLVHLYSVDPFDRVEVVTQDEKIEAIVIRLDRAFPARVVAEHLQLSAIRAVFVADELGNILGQAYPERGVILGFAPASAPGRGSMQVVQIILEPLSAEGFALRAEAGLSEDPLGALEDARLACEIDSNFARGYWLQSRALGILGDWKEAKTAIGRAIQLDAGDLQYHLQFTETLLRLGQYPEAAAVLRDLLPAAESRPHLLARAYCQAGELTIASQPPDYMRAIQYYGDAIRTAEALTSREHPAIRVAAKEVLLEAYLSAAECIAFGQWKQKEEALPRWWERAQRVASDLVETERRPLDYQLEFCRRVLACCVAMKGSVDPQPYLKVATELVPQAVPTLADNPSALTWSAVNRRRIMAAIYYDAVQLSQIAGKHEEARQFAQQAIEFLKPIAESSDWTRPSDQHLLVKLYFRIGAGYALGQKDHKAAVQWFDRALSLIDPVEKHLSAADSGRLGEILVSMGVSYWEVQAEKKGLELTERGLRLMESAVRAGQMPPSALAVPYSNLATMERKRGNTARAQQYLQQARQSRGSTLQ